MNLDVAALPDDTARDRAKMNAHLWRITRRSQGRHKVVVALGNTKRPIAVAGCGGTLLVEERLRTHVADVGGVKPFHIARRHRGSVTPGRVALEGGKECLKRAVGIARRRYLSQE